MTSTSTPATLRVLAGAAEQLPFHDTQDLEDATRGLVARSTQRQVRADDGRVVWDLDAYTFLEQDVPPTAHPSLWRQSRLNAIDGLFEVVPGLYQLRGFDLSVMTVIETDGGVVVVDPLISKETAAAAFALYREHRGDRPVRAVIYTHSHIDHFGGVKGVVSQDLVDAGRTDVIAPAGFLQHAVAENVFTGTAMGRRAGYMYGAALDRGPAGQIGAGLGQTTSTGEPTLIVPTVDVVGTGQELTVDGLRIVFQVTPGTEAPAEMNFYLPDLHALCTAENATHTLHNILTLRGAVVRDAHAWAHYLTETIALWGDDLDVVLASHHWPTWGRERAVDYLATQRDLYLYLHDQTVRMINQGYVGSEIAELLTLPPGLENAWHARGYYGSVSHNVKAIYQRYMGWYEGNPARLWKHPPQEAGRRYVRAMGGADAAVAVAQQAYDDGDYRWAAEVLDHVIFSGADHPGSRALQADTLDQLGFATENGTWRSAYLAGATELRHGSFGTPANPNAPDLLRALTVTQLFDSLAVRIDGPASADACLRLCWAVTGDATYLTELRNGALHHLTVPAPPPDVTTFRLTRLVLVDLMTGALPLADALADGTVTVDGDPGELATLVGFLAPVDPGFAIVTP
ncbi:alkyl/aryl-sulfatase [Cellulomonas soli]|uniref:Beta-lactamase-like protein n=1 Tax=Cellulomonas soli TaxID=931535 RepID=A0A512PHU0_9CELL|nr:alkyl sulfatase dimerization domain-containing protein [Cellulomonas soli]NYI59275.1 alkyl sulfatase BDS1-like metallo-beta-lactamase superfamily hydrolase [Cellulomonas soli]GEP70779.1 beta-lactamase-like protein [Cellulomonas soli]